MMSNTHYDHLMMSYAAGSLDEAQSLIVAAHCWFSKPARQAVQSYEHVGGYLMEKDCAPVSMSANALDRIMGRIEAVAQGDDNLAGTHQQRPAPATDVGCDLPAPLSEALQRSCPEKGWKKIGSGFEKLDLDLDCQQSHAQFMKAAPAAHSPEHTHGGLEITLVLDGSISDEYGHYKRGDLVITDEHTTHQIEACPKMGCTCFVVSSAPIKLTGIASILNPFLRV